MGGLSIFVDKPSYHFYINYMSKKSKNPWSEKQIDELYEIWKEAGSEKEMVSLIIERLPSVVPFAALGLIRKLSKTDKKWLQMSTRKKNQKEKAKLDKIKQREEKKKLREEKRRVREEKKKLKEKKLEEKKSINDVKENLDLRCIEELNKHIENKFFFCSHVQQYVPTISCICRVFGKEGFLHCSDCESCKHMDKYLSIIKEILNGGEKTSKQNEPKRNKTSGGSEGKE